METTKQTSQEYFKILSKLHLAMIIGVFFMGLIVAFLITSGTMSNDMGDLNETFLYIVSIAVLGGLYASNWIYKYKLRGLKEENDLKTKMTNYRGIFIHRYTFIVGPAYFSIFAVLLTSNLLLLVFTGISLLFMIYWKPTKTSIINDLELNQQEISIIENPDSIIAY
ncbi:MAG: hypothetical protein ACK5JC_01030 [Bacteroidota bacterium]|jgi:putative effector of murein hydrolase LrgA (UPF0299 family)